MMIEKLLVAARKGGPTIEAEFAKGLSVVLASTPQIRLIFLGALESMGVVGIEARTKRVEKGGRISVTVIDDNHRRVMLVRDSLSQPSVRVVDFDTGMGTEIAVPIAEAMGLSETDLACSDDGTAECGAWTVPVRLLMGDNGRRYERAISLLDGISSDSGAENAYFELRREVERVADLRIKRAELRARIAWLVERLSFLDSRISSIDAALRTKVECDEIEEYVGFLKQEFESWRVNLADVLVTEKAAEKARNRLLKYSGMEGAFDPEVAGEIRNLMSEMSELEKTAISYESEQSGITSAINGLRMELALASKDLEELEQRGLSRRTLEHAQSSLKEIEDRETRLASLSQRIAEVDKVLGRKRLADGLSVGGALLTVTSLTGLLLPENIFPWMSLSEPLMGVLILLLSTGLMCTVYGVSTGIELDAKHGAKVRLEHDRANLSSQVAWHRRRLDSLLHDMSINDYALAVEKMEWLKEKKECLLEEIKTLSGELARLRNEADLNRVRTWRAKERMGELMKVSGFSSPSMYLEAYEDYRRVEASYREAADRLEAALGGRSRESIERDIEIVLEEIASAEAQRAAIADPRIEEKIWELSEEYAIKADERERLALELEQKSLELADTEHALAGVDIWEVSSEAARAASELERARREGLAASLAQAAIEEMIEEKRAQAGARLAEVASDIMAFFTGEPTAEISCAVEEDCVRCSFPRAADSESLIPVAVLAVRLGASEVLYGRGALPLIIDYSSKGKGGRVGHKSAYQGLTLVWPALEKLGRTRQVILVLDGLEFAEQIPKSCEVLTI